MADTFSPDVSLTKAQEHEAQGKQAFEQLIARKELLAPNPEELNTQINLYSEYAEHVSIAHQLTGVLVYTHTNNSEMRDFQSRLQQESVARGEQLLYFTLTMKSWGKEQLMQLANKLPQYASFLSHLARIAPYTLSEKEERVIALKDLGGGNAIDRVYDALTGGFEYEFNGEILTRGQLAPYFLDEKREVRKQARDSLLAPHKEHESTLQELYRAVVFDTHAEAVQLRGYQSPLHARLFGDETDQEAFDALREAHEQNKHIFSKYLELKQKALGYDEFTQYDFSAPVEGLPKGIDYEKAKSTVLEVFYGVGEWMGKPATTLFEKQRVDAESRAHKVGGAFCFPMTPTTLPTLVLTHNPTYDSMSTLAHEMGHAVHSIISAPQGMLDHNAPVTLAETASNFAEQLLLHHTLAEAAPQERIALLCQSLDDSVGSISAQLRYTAFEEWAHAHISEGGAMSELNTKWSELARQDFPNINWPTESFAWATVPHIFQMPFYCYSYAYGKLLTLALWDIYAHDQEKGAQALKRILDAGGSTFATELLAKEGFDITKSSFWQKGFDAINLQIKELESLL